MTIAIIVTTVICIFAAFASAVAYAEVQTRGIYAPGALRQK